MKSSFTVSKLLGGSGDDAFYEGKNDYETEILDSQNEISGDLSQMTDSYTSVIQLISDLEELRKNQNNLEKQSLSRTL